MENGEKGAKRVRIHTLGCKLNYAESSTFVRQFEQLGVRLAEANGRADIEVVNSCAVTEQAQRKARQLLHRVRRENPAALRVMVGCYADLSGEELLQGGLVSLVVHRDQKGQLAALSLARLSAQCRVSCMDAEAEDHFFPAYSVGGRTRAFLKVQDGCDYRCTYCTIPIARGKSRSGSVAGVLREAQAIARRGVKEIVLTGVNTGEFGRGQGESLEGLLRALAEVQGLERVRVSSIEPNLLNDSLLATMASLSVVMPHLHVPLQSGSGEVLRAMRRRYTPEMYMQRIESARRALGDPFIGVDVIVGFPGEEESHFEETVELLRAVKPSYLHVFPYSPRPNTIAAAMEGRPPSEVVVQRVQRLIEFSEELHRAYCGRYAGSERRVLVERIGKDGMAEGFTDNYIKVQFPAAQCCSGQIVPVRLEGEVQGEVMQGVVVEKEAV